MVSKSASKLTSNGVVVQSHDGHQQVEAEHGLADLAAGLAQLDCLLPEIQRGGEQRQGCGHG